jgi:hypothetical protein
MRHAKEIMTRAANTPIAKALELLAERWTLLRSRVADGSRRFNDFGAASRFISSVDDVAAAEARSRGVIVREPDPAGHPTYTS